MFAGPVIELWIHMQALAIQCINVVFRWLTSAPLSCHYGDRKAAERSMLSNKRVMG